MFLRLCSPPLKSQFSRHASALRESEEMYLVGLITALIHDVTQDFYEPIQSLGGIRPFQQLTKLVEGCVPLVTFFVFVQVGNPVKGVETESITLSTDLAGNA